MTAAFPHGRGERMANKIVSRLGAQALGFAKPKGHVEHDLFGDVTLKLSEEGGARVSRGRLHSAKISGRH